MKSRNELIEFYSNDQIDCMYTKEKIKTKEELALLAQVIILPTAIGIGLSGYGIIREYKENQKYKNATEITQTYEENDHIIEVPIKWDGISEETMEVEYHEGYEIIEVTNGNAVYRNTEPVIATGLMFEDGTTEFTSFGTVIEKEKTK